MSGGLTDAFTLLLTALFPFSTNGTTKSAREWGHALLGVDP